MPLDHVRGEQVEGMDSVFIVAPFSKYAEQTNLTTIVEERRRFKRPRKVVKSIVRAAMEHAAAAYAKLGLRVGGDVDILTQEYPRTRTVLFLFCARVNGVDHYVTAPFLLGDEQIRDLTLRGLWTPYRLN